MNHYKWLDANLFPFLKAVGVKDLSLCCGLIGAHGDKVYFWRNQWEKAGIHFFHGCAIYLLTYVHPFSSEVRETKDGWVDPGQWVINNYERFKPFLNKV